MASVFSWIPQLLEWLLGWVPHMGRIQTYEAGVKMSGPRVRELRNTDRLLGIGPRGVFLWVPHFSELFRDNVVRKVVELPEQLLTTADGERVRAGGVLVYHITNVVTWLAENEDPEHGLLVDASRVMREWVRSMTFAQVQAFRPAKRGEDDLTKLAQAEMGADFGVRIRLLALASFARTDARDLHHSGALVSHGDTASSIVRMD